MINQQCALNARLLGGTSLSGMPSIASVHTSYHLPLPFLTAEPADSHMLTTETVSSHLSLTSFGKPLNRTSMVAQVVVGRDVLTLRPVNHRARMQRFW